MMNHPNIAQVLDAGTTELGRPYFVMELVHGVPITEYCDTHNLTTGAVGSVHRRLPRRPARPSKGHHPPRHQAVQHPGHVTGWPTDTEGHRLWRVESVEPAFDREDPVYGVRSDDRHAAVHEPRAGRDERPGHRYAHGRVFAWRTALRAAHGHHPARRRAAAGGGLCGDAADHPGGRAPQAQHACEHLGGQGHGHRAASPTWKSGGFAICWPANSTGLS